VGHEVGTGQSVRLQVLVETRNELAKLSEQMELSLDEVANRAIARGLTILQENPGQQAKLATTSDAQRRLTRVSAMYQILLFEAVTLKRRLTELQQRYWKGRAQLPELQRRLQELRRRP
jgi:uncharacterized coiled-coil protein SlyX